MATAVKEATVKGLSNEEVARPGGMDMGTVFGILAGVGLIMTAIIRGGSAEAFINVNGMFIVLGGTMATSFIAFPSKKILGMFPIIVNAFKPDVHHPTDYIDEIMNLVTKYRSGGMKQLESAEGLLDNRFLKEGVIMVVDGYNVREINEVMERQISSLIERHNQGQKILRFAAVQAPIFGMAGTLIGLIQMLMHLNDPATIGPGLAVALITTFYGLMLANLIISPIVAKLNTRTENEAMLIKAIRVGVLGINEKLNPQKIQRNMNSLLPPDQQR
ncbi:MAG: motility protein A [Nitrospinales bacterium]